MGLASKEKGESKVGEAPCGASNGESKGELGDSGTSEMVAIVGGVEEGGVDTTGILFPEEERKEEAGEVFVGGDVDNSPDPIATLLEPKETPGRFAPLGLTTPEVNVS